MFDIKLIRENPKLVEENLRKRNDPEKIKLLKEITDNDKKRRKLIQEVDELRRQRNIVTKEIAELRRDGKSVTEKLARAKAIPDKIKEKEEELERIETAVRRGLFSLPNMLHESVPIGKDDSENVEIRKWGNIPEFGFKPKTHVEILRNLGMIDLERAVKVAGSGFYYLKGDVVILDLALQRFALDFLRKKGFVVVEPPYMIKRDAYEGMIDFEDFEMVTYKVGKDDVYLIATSEHPMGAMFMNETLNIEELPIKLAGVSPCFRKEVGSHGKYTKGIFRVHQFNKIEQFIFSCPDDSWKLHDELQENSEKLYQQLEIPYRVVNVCTGDIGTVAAKKYDIEGYWVDGNYRELGSNSNCTDYQARRLNLKYRIKEGQAPAGFVHTLNNTALATSRTMIAIIELNQQEDGTVKIPRVLWPYTGFRVLGEK